jgi:hypothetical protein
MRKDKSNPFVSISDLMAGVTAVVMLLLVVSVVRTAINAAEIEHQKQIHEQERIDRKNRGVRQAIKEIKEKYSRIDKVPTDICYLTGDLRQDYLHDMKLCQEFAWQNRLEMLRRILKFLS